MFSTTKLSSAVKYLNDAYDQDWHLWLPETLKTVVEARWGKVDDMHFERLLAVRNLLKDGFFWHDVDVFEATINAFNWIESDHRVASHPSPARIVLGVKVARDIAGEEPKLGSEVLKYIASIFIDRDLIYVPKSFGLGNTQEYVDVYFKNQDLQKIVAVKWRLIQDGDEMELEEKSADVQIAKLLAIKRFVDMGGVASPEDRESFLANLKSG